MARKRTNNEWTTLRVRWETKYAFLDFGIGRETDDEILQRLLKRQQVKVVKKEDSAEYLNKLKMKKKSY